MQIPTVGTNRYSYSLNDPINLSDPGGNCPVCVVAVVAAISFGASADPGNAPGFDENGDPQQALPQNGVENMVGAAVTAATLGGGAIVVGREALDFAANQTLKKLTKKAVRKVDEAVKEAKETGSTKPLLDVGATPKEALRIMQGGSQARKFRGTVIDRKVKCEASDAWATKNLEAPGPFKYGPGFSNSKTRNAWDMTTEGEWEKHVEKYLVSGPYKSLKRLKTD